MNLVYSAEAYERIRSLPPEVKRGIREVLDRLCDDPHQGKALQRELTGFWTIAFRRYRIIYRPMPESRRIRIYTVGRREEIYRDFAKSPIFLK